MIFHVVLNDEDYIKFNIFHMFNTKQGKKTLWISRLSMPFIAICFLLVFYTADVRKTLFVSECITLSVFSVLWVILYPALIKRRLRSRIKTLEKKGKLPYTKEADLEFTDTSIIETTDKMTCRTDYPEVEQVYENDEYLYIYKNVVSALILPKQFVHGEDLDRVRSLLRMR